jgi:hypothetical protein
VSSPRDEGDVHSEVAVGCPIILREKKCTTSGMSVQMWHYMLGIQPTDLSQPLLAVLARPHSAAGGGPTTMDGGYP